MSARILPTWRSLMFCPANAQQFIAKAYTRGADAIILDLEDSVSSAEKDSARAGVATAAKVVGQTGSDVLVRINRELPSAIADIASAVCEAVMGLVIPKVMGAEHIRLLVEVIAARELELDLPVGHTKLVALVESAAALEHLNAIARSDERLVAIAVGGEDLATDLDAQPTADTLYVAKMLGLHAARAAGILPMGVLASVAGVSDSEPYRAMLARSRALGFACASCVHPAQVPLINAAFSPSADELDRARRLVAAYEKSIALGNGATLFEGSMVDKPVADRAHRVLARASA